MVEILRVFKSTHADFYEFVDDLLESGIWEDDEPALFGKILGIEISNKLDNPEPLATFGFGELIARLGALLDWMVDSVRAYRRKLLQRLEDLAARRHPVKTQRSSDSARPREPGGETGSERLDASEGEVPTSRPVVPPEGDHLAGGAPGPPESGDLSSQAGYLGLMVNPMTHSVKRKGYPDAVEINGRRGRLVWNYFMFLFGKRELGHPKEELRSRWEEFGGDRDPSDSAFWDAPYRLNKLLAPLAVRAEFHQDRYVLVDAEFI